MKYLNVSKKIDRLNDSVGKGVSYLVLIMVLLTCLIAILRYVFKIGFISMQDAVIYMHSAAFLLPAAVALRLGYHVRVDIFYASLTPQKKALINGLGAVFILIPVMIFCFAISWNYVAFSWKHLEGARDTGGIEAVFLLKTLLLIMPTLMILQGISEAIKSYYIYTNQLEPEENPRQH